MKKPDNFFSESFSSKEGGKSKNFSLTVFFMEKKFIPKKKEKRNLFGFHNFFVIIFVVIIIIFYFTFYSFDLVVGWERSVFLDKK